MALTRAFKGTKKPERLILYGPPGIGKSTFGSKAENPIFVTTEDGADNLNVLQYPIAKTYDELWGNLREVLTQDHDHKALILDTLNGAAKLCSKKVCVEKFNNEMVSGNGIIGFDSFARGWGGVADEMEAMKELFNACRDERGMKIFILAHTGLHTVKHPTKGDYTKFAPDVDKRIWSNWHGWADIILRAEYDFTVKEGKDGKKGSADLGGDDRLLFSLGDASQDCKARVGYELPDVMPFHYSIYNKELNGVDPKAVEELRKLWGQLEEGKEALALDYLEIKSIDDVESAELGKILAMIQKIKSMDKGEK